MLLIFRYEQLKQYARCQFNDDISVAGDGRCESGDTGDGIFLQTVSQVLQQRNNGSYHPLQVPGSLR